MSSLASTNVALGDVVTVTFLDDQQGTLQGTVKNFITDEQQGFSPEIEDYVACSLEIEPLDGSISQMVILGTDLRYTLDGREVRIVKESP